MLKCETCIGLLFYSRVGYSLSNHSSKYRQANLVLSVVAVVSIFILRYDLIAKNSRPNIAVNQKHMGFVSMDPINKR